MSAIDGFVNVRLEPEVGSTSVPVNRNIHDLRADSESKKSDSVRVRLACRRCMTV